MTPQQMNFLHMPRSTIEKLLDFITNDAFEPLDLHQKDLLIKQLAKLLDFNQKLSYLSEEERAKVVMAEFKARHSSPTRTALTIGLTALVVAGAIVTATVSINWMNASKEMTADKIRLNKNQLQQCISDPARPITVQSANNQLVYVSCPR